MAVFLNILSNISNLMIPVHMNGLDSDASLVKVHIGTNSQGQKPSKTHSAKLLPLF